MSVHERKNPPQVQAGEDHLRLRSQLHDRVDEAGAPRGGLRGLPSVLHRNAAHPRRPGSCRAVHEAVREETGRRTRLRGGRPAPLGADRARLRMTEKKQQPALYGGQAVIEGVMIRGRRTVALACRKPNGDIYRYREPLRSPLVRSRVARLPFVRGVVVLWESLDYGIRMLMRSADVQLETETQQLGKGGNTLVIAVALGGALLL